MMTSASVNSVLQGAQPMFTTSKYLLLVGSGALISLAGLVAAGGSAATAQTMPGRQAPPPSAEQPFSAEGHVIVNGQVIGRDPDQNIRSSLLREFEHQGGD
jgi:hypothetical protein